MEESIAWLVVLYILSSNVQFDRLDRGGSVDGALKLDSASLVGFGSMSHFGCLPAEGLVVALVSRLECVA